MCRFTEFDMQIGEDSYRKLWSKFQYNRIKTFNTSLAEQYIGDYGDYVEYSQSETKSTQPLNK